MFCFDFWAVGKLKKIDWSEYYHSGQDISDLSSVEGVLCSNLWSSLFFFCLQNIGLAITHWLWLIFNITNLLLPKHNTWDVNLSFELRSIGFVFVIFFAIFSTSSEFRYSEFRYPEYRLPRIQILRIQKLWQCCSNAFPNSLEGRRRWR